MSIYYTSPPIVIDGDIAYAKDVNDINQETDAGFAAVESDFISLSGIVQAWAELAEKWAQNPEDVEVEPSQYSALHWSAKSDGFSQAASASAIAAFNSETAAALSAANAATSETNAATSETNASTSETNAGLSETAAALSETNALASENKAEEWAENPEDVEVEVGKYSALHWAAKSEEKVLTIPDVSLGTPNDIIQVNATQDAYEFAERVIQDSPTGAASLPSGTTAQRGTGAAGKFRFNTEDGSFEGYNGIEWGEIGGGGLQWLLTTTSITAEFNRGYIVDTETPDAVLTVTLPASPDVGDQVGFLAVGQTHYPIIAGNGENIQGIADDLELDTFEQSCLLVYVDAAFGWRLTWASPTSSVGTAPEIAPVAARKNLLINGAGQVSQRGKSEGDILTSGDWILDRWRGFFTVGTFYALNEVYAGDTISTYGIYNNSPVDPVLGEYVLPLRQGIEGYNVSQLSGGGTVTLSFIARSSKAGIHAARFIVYGDSVVRSTYKEFTLDVAASYQHVSLTLDIPATYIGAARKNLVGMYVDIGLICGPDNQTQPDIWYEGTDSQGTVNSVVWSDESVGFFEVSEVQLEVGDTATEFEYRNYGEELALCQRYYEYGSTSSTAGSAIGTTSMAGGASWFKVVKRVIPTVLPIDPEYYQGGWKTPTTTTLTATEYGLRVSWVTADAMVSGYSYACKYSWTADAEL